VKNNSDLIVPYVFEAIGAASMCWIGGTGSLVFDTDTATAIAEQLIKDIRKLYEESIS
jgi:hypothetical protein